MALEFLSHKGQAVDTETFQVVRPGENIQVGDLEVHITTAVHYPNYPVQGGFNIFLNGWARHKINAKFKCCLMNSLSNGTTQDSNITEVKAKYHHEYAQWVVDMQNVEFSCLVSGQQLKNIEEKKFRYVTFAKGSCINVSSQVMEILYPKPAPGCVGICLKVTYGTLNPEKMVEWFEYARLMNVTKVFTYYFDLDPQVFKVLEYYRDIGFLDLLLIHPAKSKNGPDRGFRPPRYSEQAWMDATMAANDCKHRLSTFDYLFIMDMDEIMVPTANLTSYLDVLKATQKKFPQAAGFRLDSFIFILSRTDNRTSPLHFLRITKRTKTRNLIPWSIGSRWAFKPSRTFWVQNNLVHPREPYTNVIVPKELQQMHHYRACKAAYKNCYKLELAKDPILVQYEETLVHRLLALPLGDILYDNKNYVKELRAWSQKNKNITATI